MSAVKIGELGGGRLSSKTGAKAKNSCVPATPDAAGAKHKVLVQEGDQVK